MENIMKNESNLKYTYKHRKVVMYLANKYIKENKDAILCRMKNHDLDKMFMYLFYDKEDVSQIHRRLSSHHKNELEKDYIDLNISPGGCADLLAISILLINIKKKFYNDLNKKNITEN